MTEQEQQLRENSRMSAFTFYLDDITKLKVIRKLKQMSLDTMKGSISATIRVLLSNFADSQPDYKLCEQIKQEYILTTKKSKRSTL